jgi:hypothetical protein
MINAAHHHSLVAGVCYQCHKKRRLQSDERVRPRPGVHPAKARQIAANVAKLPELLRKE